MPPPTSNTNFGSTSEAAIPSGEKNRLEKIQIGGLCQPNLFPSIFPIKPQSLGRFNKSNFFPIYFSPPKSFAFIFLRKVSEMSPKVRARLKYEVRELPVQRALQEAPHVGFTVQEVPGDTQAFRSNSSLSSMRSRAMASQRCTASCHIISSRSTLSGVSRVVAIGTKKTVQHSKDTTKDS